MDVEDGRGSETAALGEDEVRRHPQVTLPCSPYWSLGLCILEKKGLRPYMRAKKMPARM